MKGGAHRSPPFSAGSRIDDDDVIKYSRRGWWWSRLIGQKKKYFFSRFFQLLPIASNPRIQQPSEGHPNIPKIEENDHPEVFPKANEGSSWRKRKRERERERGKEKEPF